MGWSWVKFKNLEFRIETRHDLEILKYCGKRVKTKIQKGFKANSEVKRSYRVNTG